MCLCASSSCLMSNIRKIFKMLTHRRQRTTGAKAGKSGNEGLRHSSGQHTRRGTQGPETGTTESCSPGTCPQLSLLKSFPEAEARIATVHTSSQMPAFSPAWRRPEDQCRHGNCSSSGTRLCLSTVTAHSLQPAAWQTPAHTTDWGALANLVPITVPGKKLRGFAR